ncbi:MAG: PEP-CTERM sorting domain-containing protein [Armatimonadota bacterium]
MKASKLMACGATLIALLAGQAGAASLVGQWTFDGNGGTGALENKAAGATWDTMALFGTGATVVDGKLVLPRYQDTTWKQTNAIAKLAVDMGPTGYFKEMTQVLWLKWSDFNTTSDWTSISGVTKSTMSNFDPTQQQTVKAAQRIVMKATDNNNWYGNRVYETSGTVIGSQWAKNGGSDPLTDRYIKIAQVVKPFDTTKYQQLLYWDLGDGNGLVQVGAAFTTIWNAWAMPFGQSGTDCIPFPGGGNRYDYFTLMDYAWSTPQAAGDSFFDEARLYSGALTTTEIGALTAAAYVPVPDVPEPGGLLALATGICGLAGFAVRRRK